MLRTMMLAAFCLCAATARAAPDAGAAALFARAKAAAGGERWDTLGSWRGDGTVASGGLAGQFHAMVDVKTGRAAHVYTLGSVDGAEGYDGRRGWVRDPGGEVAALDAPGALRRARAQSWLDARAYWFPERGAARYGKPESRTENGKRFTVLTATPRDADPLKLWFDADGMLAQVQQTQGRDMAITRYDDFREVDGVRLPYHYIVDHTDAAGRTDPRRRTEVHFEKIAINVPVADNYFAMPQVKPNARIVEDDGVAQVPFQLVNNHIYVDAGINAKPGAHLIVDTGGANRLTPAAAQKFGVDGDGSLSAAGSGVQPQDLALGRARVATIGLVELDRPLFHIVDLGQLARVEGVDVDGVAGYEMFRQFGVKIDYAFKKLTISAADKFVAPAGAVALPFELDGQVPVVHAMLDGLPLRIGIDTGARGSLTLHAPFVQKHGLVARYHAAASAVTDWGVAGAQQGHPARLGTLQIGELRIGGIAGDLVTDGKDSNPGVDARVGGGVLRRFTVAFDYPRRMVYLKPNAAFARPDVFDRSGLWLLAAGDALAVADVAGGSAAARAGLKAGDEIVAINGEPVAKRPLAEWRTYFAATMAGTKVGVDFRRGGAPHSAALELADRIAPTWSE